MGRTQCFLLPIVIQAILLLAALLSPPCTAEQVLVAPGQLQSGQSLSFLQYKFELRGDCKLVVYDGNKVIWNTDSDVVPSQGCVATLTKDGRLAVHDPLCITQVWQSGHQTRGSGDYALVLLPGGEVAIYNKLLWATDTYFRSHYYVSSPQVLIPGSKLRAGEYLSVGTYKFAMESNCSLSLSNQGKTIWKASSNKGVGCFAAFDSDGHLRLYDKRNNKMWESTNSAVSPSTVLVMQPSRQVAIWTGAIWSTGAKSTSAKYSSETIRMVTGTA